MNEPLRRTTFETFKHGINFEISFWFYKYDPEGKEETGIHTEIVVVSILIT